MGVLIRKAKKDDFGSIWYLFKQLFFKNKMSKVKTQNLILNLLKDKESVMLVMVLDKQIIGYVAVKFRNDIQVQGKIAYMSEFVIEESFRNKGFGTKLLKYIISTLKKRNCKELHLSSTFKRKKAHKFYEALGFNKTAYFFWKKL